MEDGVEDGWINAEEKNPRKRSTDIGQQTKQRPRLRTAIEKESRFVLGFCTGGFISYDNSNTGARCGPTDDLNEINEQSFS